MSAEFVARLLEAEISVTSVGEHRLWYSTLAVFGLTALDVMFTG